MGIATKILSSLTLTHLPSSLNHMLRISLNSRDWERHSLILTIHRITTRNASDRVLHSTNTLPIEWKQSLGIGLSTARTGGSGCSLPGTGRSTPWRLILASICLIVYVMHNGWGNFLDRGLDRRLLATYASSSTCSSTLICIAIRRRWLLSCY